MNTMSKKGLFSAFSAYTIYKFFSGKLLPEILCVLFMQLLQRMPNSGWLCTSFDDIMSAYENQN